MLLYERWWALLCANISVFSRNANRIQRLMFFSTRIRTRRRAFYVCLLPNTTYHTAIGSSVSHTLFIAEIIVSPHSASRDRVDAWLIMLPLSLGLWCATYGFNKFTINEPYGKAFISVVRNKQNLCMIAIYGYRTLVLHPMKKENDVWCLIHIVKALIDMCSDSTKGFELSCKTANIVRATFNYLSIPHCS